MEDPAQEIKTVIRTLTQGTPDAQHDAVYRYFAPGATFEHPFCSVPSFKDVNVPRVGTIDSRVLIAAIYRWYKVLSPTIEIEIESSAYDKHNHLLYLTIFQVFSLWFIPFHSAPVRLVTVLRLTPAHVAGGGTPPPIYGAAQEKLQAVLEGEEPSYAAVTGGASGTPPAQTEEKKKGGDKPPPSSKAAGKATASGSGSKAADKAPASGSDSASGSSSRTEPGPTRYVIQRQQDLYQVNEYFKFVTLTPLLPAIIGFLQLLAALTCWAGAATLGPVVKAFRPAEQKEKD